MNEYERMAREHDNRQPFIQDELVEAIKSYNCVTYRQLAGHINNWCQHSCIQTWLRSHCIAGHGSARALPHYRFALPKKSCLRTLILVETMFLYNSQVDLWCPYRPFPEVHVVRR